MAITAVVVEIYHEYIFHEITDDRLMAALRKFCFPLEIYKFSSFEWTTSFRFP